MNIAEIDEIEALTAVIAGEARGEGVIGKMAVACVVRNRLRDRRWPADWKGVVFQPLQFSSMNTIGPDGEIPERLRACCFTRTWADRWWRECKFAAFGVVYDWYEDFTHGANHYYAHGRMREPWWAVGVTPCYTTSGHTFYDM